VEGGRVGHEIQTEREKERERKNAASLRSPPPLGNTT